MMYVSIYCILIGIFADTTAMMSKSYPHLGGSHWHKYLYIPVDKNISIYRRAKLAILSILQDPIKVNYRLVPAQDGPFFYTRSHLSALQNCALLYSTNFQFIFIFKNALHNLVIELCSAPFFFKNIAQILINLTHSFVAI